MKVQFATLAMALVLTGCDVGPAQEAESIGKAGEYAGVAVADDGSVIVGRLADPASRRPASLLRISADSAETLPGADFDACDDPDLLVPHQMPDRHIAAVAACPQSVDARVVALQGGAWAPVTPLPTTPRAIAWGPSGDSAILAVGSEVCGSIAWLRDGALEAIDLSIGDGDSQFSLADALATIPGGDCGATGRASWPAISPSGEVAFFASPASVHAEGQERLDKPWDLMRWQPETDAIEVLATGINSPRGLAWSSSGHQLAFSGAMASEDGTWVWSDGALSRVSGEVLEWPSWATDHELVGLHRVGSGPQMQLVRVTVNDN